MGDFVYNFPEVHIHKLSEPIQSMYNTVTAICSAESRVTNATKTFAGESSLTGAIVQTRAATTGILLEDENYKECKSLLSPPIRDRSFFMG